MSTHRSCRGSSAMVIEESCFPKKTSLWASQMQEGGPVPLQAFDR
jgi:hypothetical protein